MASGYVGVLTCELHFPEAHSLKEKRSVVRPIVAEVRKRFEVSVAEAGHLELHRRALIGIAVVAPDAAAQIPPVANLWHFTRELGADAAIFSGGKGLRGPQSSGLVLGGHGLIDACVPNGPPNHSVGRPMKVGKEEMLGILAAVEWSLQQDEGALLARYEAMVQRWIAGLADVPGVRVERGFPSEAGQPHARAIVHLAPESAWTRAKLVRALWDAEPRIAVGEVGSDAIALNPQTLEPGEDEIILEALRRLLLG